MTKAESNTVVILSVEPNDGQAFTTDDDGMRTVSPKEVAVHGCCKIEREADVFFGGPKSCRYIGSVMNSPTWGEIVNETCRSIISTKDRHHVFLEGVEIVRHDAGINVLHLILGS